MEENYNLVNPELVEYIKTNIFPRYEKTKGHGVSHIQNVIRRSLAFAKRINDGEIKVTAKDFKNLPDDLAKHKKLNYDICFAVAAYHDLGREQNDALHHLVSAALFLTDEKMQGFFSRDELRVAADAIMDHRASNKMEPLSIYGRIVSSADRDTDYRDIIKRAYEYNRAKYPEKTADEALAIVREKLYVKFGAPEAYGAKKMFFDNPEYTKMIEVFQRITPDEKVFRDEALGLIAEI